MFGRDYEEIGSDEKGLILKNSGKVKIQWGKKFIDLLDSDGNLNVNIKPLIRKASSDSDLKDDGFYYYDDKLIAKVGNNILELTQESGTTFVSFMIEQEATDEQKYTALKNIGFIYENQSEYNTYPKNGIVYIENSKSLFIVNNGMLTKYVAPIPNPFKDQFIIKREITEDNNTEGALIIEGYGLDNALVFDSMKIFSGELYAAFQTEKEFKFDIGNKSTVLIDLNGITTNSIQSVDATSSYGYRIYEEDGKYILDIDKINVRDKVDVEDPLDYFDNNIYSKRFTINSFEIKYKEVQNKICLDYVLFNANINNLVLDNNSLIQIPVRVVKCDLSNVTSNGETLYYLDPISYISYRKSIEGRDVITQQPKEEILNLIFKYQNYRLLLLNEDLDEVIYPEIGMYPFGKKLGNQRYYIKLTFDNDTYYYAFSKEKIIDDAFRRSLYVVSEPNTDSRLRFDFDDPSITLQQNDRRNTRLSEYDQIKHVKIGDIHNRKTYYDDLNDYGLFSDRNVFVGGEFRQPIPTQKKVNGYLQDVPEDMYYYHFPRYSEDLTKGMTLQIFNHDEIILPKKWIPQAANYIEDLTEYSGTLESRDDNLYDGKLFLYKVTGTSGNNITASFHLSPQYDKNGNIINTRSFGPYTFYDRGTAVKENDYKQNTILLAQYKNGQINVLRNPGLITIKSEGSTIETEPKFDTINFKGSIYVNFTVSKSSKTINVKVNITQALENRLTAIENDISDIKSNISSIWTSINTMNSNIRTLNSSMNSLDTRITNVNTAISGINSEITAIKSDIADLKANQNGQSS